MASLDGGTSLMAVQIRHAVSADAALLPDIERSAGELFRTVPDLAWIAGDEVMSAEAHLEHIAQGTVWVAQEEGASSASSPRRESATSCTSGRSRFTRAIRAAASVGS